MMKGQIILVVLVATIYLVQADINNFCLNVADNGRFVRSPRSCQHWIFCQNNRATEGQCPGIFHFDEKIQMCRYAEFVQCDFDQVNVTCPTTRGLELLPHPTTCDQYVACTNGFPKVMNCAPGLFWDQSRKLCDLPGNVPHCKPAEDDLDYKCIPGEVYLTAHPNNCQRFVVCVNGERRVNSCANGLKFDPIKLRCDQPANVKCEVPAIPDIPSIVCDPKVPFKRIPYPSNCQNYVVCISGTKQIERCAEGLIFNRNLLMCDVPQNFVCPVATLA